MTSCLAAVLLTLACVFNGLNVNTIPESSTADSHKYRFDKSISREVLEADSDVILQACIFEIAAAQIEQIPVPNWVLTALNQPVEQRCFRCAEMLCPNGRLKDFWRPGHSVPDVSRTETKLWFYFLGASFIDVGCEAIHLGQTEFMNGNDHNLAHYAQVPALIQSYAAQHARRRLVLLDSPLPSGGLVRHGQLLMDFHSSLERSL